MKKHLIALAILLATITFNNVQASSNTPDNLHVNKLTPELLLTPPDMDQIRKEDIERDKKGVLYRIGVPVYTNITTVNNGIWYTTENGTKIWELKVKSAGAEALSFIFHTFLLQGNSYMTVSDLKGNLLHEPVTKEDMLDFNQQHLALCFGDEMVLRLFEPAGTTGSEILIDRVMYNYRSTGNPAAIEKINESESCEVNVNCSPAGDNAQEIKRGVVRIYLVDSDGAGYCSGSLVNNTDMDCKPYILTALHCGVSTSAANSALWRFYFNYEAPTCTNPTTVGTLASHYITGCIRKANSNDNGGDTGSDFLLIQMGTSTNESTVITTLKSYNAFWNGWDANNTSTTGGLGIHHPSGDIKKISTFSGSTVSSTYGGTTGTHWQVTWTSNSNGWGVTEPGSSGSPLFNKTGKIIGTLTGGNADCSSQSYPDLYGKVSYHWTSNSSTVSDYQLKTYLDPGNTGTKILDGFPDPCSPAGIELIDAENNITLYPNPVKEQLTIDFSDVNNTLSNIEIYDMTGNLIKSVNLSDNLTETTINLNELKAGIYRIKLKGKNQFFIKKFVKI